MVNNVMSQGEFMRLYNIYFMCKKHIDTISSFNFKDNGNNTFTFTNWFDVKLVLNELYSIASIKDAVKNLHNCIDPINRDAKSPIISATIRNSINSNQNILISKMQAIIELYDSIGSSAQEIGIDVKIPKCSDLKEYINYLKEIDFIFTQCPFLLSKDETIVFNTVDVGSTWITFAVISGASFYILNNIANLIKQAVAIKSNMLVYKQQEEQLHAMKSKNEVSDDVISAFKTLKDKLLRDTVKSLEDEIVPLSDGEEKDKAAKSIEKLIFLMDKGVEIYSSIEAPPEVKVMFPMQENPTLLTEDVLKLLEDKNK